MKRAFFRDGTLVSDVEVYQRRIVAEHSLEDNFVVTGSFLGLDLVIISSCG